eukprot:14906602-Alexandrium_andersonii.AAC.1
MVTPVHQGWRRWVPGHMGKPCAGPRGAHKGGDMGQATPRSTAHLLRRRVCDLGQTEPRSNEVGGDAQG